MKSRQSVWIARISILALYLVAGALAGAEENALSDSVIFGNEQSEAQHGFSSDHSDTIKGGLSEPARRLLPKEEGNWEGGRLAVNLKVDPEKPNYITVRLWGGDVTVNRLILYCDGKQIGYRHLGDIDLLDDGSEAPGYPGRFYDATSPLPLELTRGKTVLPFEIRSNGFIWGYGTTFDQYQKPMKEPTRGIYALYSHTGGFFIPPASEKQGEPPADVPVRKEPGAEVLVKLRERLQREVAKLLIAKNPLNQVQMHLLARAYHVKWSPAYQNPKAAEQIARACDALFAAYKKDPKFAQSDPAVYNSDWFGLGMAGDAVRLLATPLQPFLDLPVSGDGGIKRRAAWSEMLVASRDWHRAHRRLYTNQTMIVDLNLYRANRGVAVLDPPQALPEKEMLHYLYEAVGLQPWLGSDTANGPEKRLGTDYYQLTAKGLTRELGYVGNYGEVLDWVTQIYDATREPGQPGDEKIKAQIAKIVRARAVFRYPMPDDEGNRAMRIETVVGWRDVHFPGDVAYGERATWDASTLYTAAAVLDPESVGYSQQMLEDNQFFESVKVRMKDGSLRVTAGMLGVPDQYEAIAALPPNPRRLPMTPGQPDFAFGDEEDGVVAIKHGDEILYVSLYWRARYAVNFLARVHHVTPRFSRVAVVREETEYEPSGMTYTRPDWVNMGFANGGFHYPGGLHSAHTGEKLPIAKIPGDNPFKPGTESVYAGRGSFYRLEYGNYLIAMNMTKEKTFELKVPPGLTAAPELISGKTVSLGAPIKVPPQSTVVLWLGR